MTYDGLESCILNNQSYDNESRTSRGDGCVTDSLDDDDSSCSSSKDAFGSFSSKWSTMKRGEQGSDEWEMSESPKHFYVKQKPAYAIQFSDVETMKEKFSKLLLGEDITGGRMGVSTALALSNAITNLAGRLSLFSYQSIFYLVLFLLYLYNKFSIEIFLLDISLVPTSSTDANETAILAHVTL